MTVTFTYVSCYLLCLSVFLIWWLSWLSNWSNKEMRKRLPKHIFGSGYEAGCMWLWDTTRSWKVWPNWWIKFLIDSYYSLLRKHKRQEVEFLEEASQRSMSLGLYFVLAPSRVCLSLLLDCLELTSSSWPHVFTIVKFFLRNLKPTKHDLTSLKPWAKISISSIWYLWHVFCISDPVRTKTFSFEVMAS